MPKVIVSKATQAATQSVLRQLMPDIDDLLSDIRVQVRSLRDVVRTLDSKVDNRRNEMLERFESSLDVINEMSHRVTRLDGRLDGHMEALSLIVDGPRPSRKRRAG